MIIKSHLLYVPDWVAYLKAKGTVVGCSSTRTGLVMSNYEEYKVMSSFVVFFQGTVVFYLFK
jgi:hypothetical protein